MVAIHRWHIRALSSGSSISIARPARAPGIGPDKLKVGVHAMGFVGRWTNAQRKTPSSRLGGI